MLLIEPMGRIYTSHWHSLCWYYFILYIYFHFRLLLSISIVICLQTFPDSSQLNTAEMKYLEEAVKAVHIEGSHPLNVTLQHRLLVGVLI